MALLSVIFFGFLSFCAIVACLRSGKVVIKMINNLFDSIEERFC